MCERVSCGSLTAALAPALRVTQPGPEVTELAEGVTLCCANAVLSATRCSGGLTLAVEVVRKVFGYTLV